MSGYAQVAIDGPAGSGKTTVARELARRLEFLYLDTGAMYRAVAVLALEAGGDAADEPAMVALATKRPISVTLDPAMPGGFRVYAGSTLLGDELYGNEVSRIVSAVAAHPRIRDLMVDRQRRIAEAGPVVMAGRDIGTVVLPSAPTKVYLTASLEERVERRRAELERRGVSVERGALREELRARDGADTGRAVAPLRPAAGAVEIDSTGMTVTAVVERIAHLVAVR